MKTQKRTSISKGYQWCLWLLLLLFILPLSAVEAAPSKEKKDITNVLCIWTDREHLKAITIMSFDSDNGRIGILSIPIFAHLEPKSTEPTVAQVWYQAGREGLKKRLESVLQIKIHSHISFDQPIIERASQLVGTIDVKNRETTILQAFEDTRLERRKDDQDVLRAMAANIISPSGIGKVPRLLWIFTTQVDSDLQPDMMVKLYKVIRHQGPTILTKKGLQGKDYYEKGCRYRLVEPTTWKNAINEITA